MNADNIEEMVRVLAGSFPNSGVFTPDVVKAWQKHDVIAGMTVEEARVVQKTLVNKYREFPNAFDVASTYWKLFSKQKDGCKACESSGWIRPPDDKDGWRGTTTIEGVRYHYVTKCGICSN